MGKRLECDNVRVEVVARSPGDYGYCSIGNQRRSFEDERRECESLADQIRRHVDGLPSGHGRGVDVVWDDHIVCEFCGSRWTEDGEHNGGCCEKDLEAWADARPKDFACGDCEQAWECKCAFDPYNVGAKAGIDCLAAK